MLQFDSAYEMTIGGRGAAGSSTLPAFNPATREEIARVPDGSREQLDEAVAAARKAFGTWSVAPLAARQEIVRRMGEAIEKHAEDFMKLLTREQGKPRAGAEWEILGSAAWLKAMATMSPSSMMVTVDMGRLKTVPRQAQRMVFLESTACKTPSRLTPMTMAVTAFTSVGCTLAR